MSPGELSYSETHVNGFSHADKLQFLTLFQQHKNPFKVCELVGISPATYYHHQYIDPWFNEQITLVKRSIAYSLVPRQYERALLNSVTDAIWLQKVLGGSEFNPELRHTVDLQVSLPPLTQRPDPLLNITPPKTVLSTNTNTVLSTSTSTTPTSTPPLLLPPTQTSLESVQGLGLKEGGGSVYVTPSPDTVDIQKGEQSKTQGKQRKKRKTYRPRYARVKQPRPECPVHPGVHHYKPCLGERQYVGSKWMRVKAQRRETDAD